MGQLELLLPPWTGLEGPLAAALQTRPSPIQARKGREDPCPVLGGGSLVPISSYISYALKAKPPPPPPAVLQRGPLAVLAGLRCPG